MSAMIELAYPWVLALGWTLLHSLWQGALIWGLFAFAMVVLRDARPDLRYGTGLVALAALALTPLITFTLLLPESSTAAATTDPLVLGGTAIVSQQVSVSWIHRLRMLVEALLPWMVALWLVGVGVQTRRLMNALASVKGLRHRAITELEPALRQRAAELARRFGLARGVRVVTSTLVQVPTVLGWMRPIVLLPPAVLTGLSPQQLDLILAHEFAHIRRNDYLVNLIQVLVETLMFFHPAVHAVSARLREEREACCDDRVVETLGQPLTYARALTELEGLRNSEPLCLAASGGHLMVRVERLLGVRRSRGETIWSHLAVTATTATLLLTGGQVTLSALDGQQTVDGERVTQPLILPEAATRPAPVEPSPGSSTDSAESDTGSETVRPASATPVATSERSAGTRASAGAVAETTIAPVEGAGVAYPEPVEPETDSATTFARELEEPPTDPEAAEAGPAGAAPLVERSAPWERGSLAPVFTGGDALYTPLPNFPEGLRLDVDESAMVTARFTVTVTGDVQDVAIVGADVNPYLAISVREALRVWNFEPYRFEGEPMERRFERSFLFRVTEGEALRTSSSCEPITGSRVCPSRPIRARDYAVTVLE